MACRKFTLSTVFSMGVLLFAAVCNSGCAEFYAYSSPSELMAPPFSMPNGFPLPGDAKILSRECAAKGGNCTITFESDQRLESLFEFYRMHMSAVGLTENPSYTSLGQEGFNLSFGGWPVGKAVYINGVDMGYRGSRDYRMISAQVQ